MVIYNNNDNNLKPLTLLDISNKSLENFWERKPQEVNLWIEKKFENEIDLNNLNLFEGDQIKLIEYMDKNVVDRNLTLKTFQPLTLKMNDFGTKEELIRQQKYIARYNKALMIEAKNKTYYHENKNNVINWYVEQVNKNRDNILKYVAENNLIVAVLVAISQYFSLKQINDINKPKKEAIIDPNEKVDFAQEFSKNMSKNMTYTLPVIIGIVSYQVSVAVALYFLTSNIVSIVQQTLMLRKKNAQK